MLTRRSMMVLMTGAAAACTPRYVLEERPISAGVSRAFPGDFARTSAAVDAAMETLPVNILQPAMDGQRRVVRFERPVTSRGWDESGRVVITPVDRLTTRVTVAVSSRDPTDFGSSLEATYANRIFNVVDEFLRTHG